MLEMELGVRGAERSRVCVAPREERRSKFRGEAVVMIGLNPESLANWMTVGGGWDRQYRRSVKLTGVRTCLTNGGRTT